MSAPIIDGTSPTESLEVCALFKLAEKVFGYTASELLAKSEEKLVPLRYPTEHRVIREKYFKALCMRPVGAGRGVFAPRIGGTEFPFVIGPNPVESDQGMVDATERTRLESDSARLQAEVNHPAKLATAGQKISGLVREIDLPLAAAAECVLSCSRMSKRNELNKIEKLIQCLEASGSLASPRTMNFGFALSTCDAEAYE